MNKALRCINFCDHREHVVKFLVKNNILQVNEIFKIELAKFMYRFSHNSLPDCFREYFVEVINKHKHLTRSSTNNFYVPRKKCAKGQSGLNYLGPRLWLEIPDNIKKKNTMKSFTVSYKKLLIESYDVDC